MAKQHDVLNPQSCVQCPPINPNRMAGQRRFPFILSDHFLGFPMCDLHIHLKQNDSSHFLMGKKNLVKRPGRSPFTSVSLKFLNSKIDDFPKGLSGEKVFEAIDRSLLVVSCGFQASESLQQKTCKKKAISKKKQFLEPFHKPKPKKKLKL